MELLAFIGLGICVGYASILLPGLARTEFLRDVCTNPCQGQAEVTPLVSIILAARNESTTIRQTLQALGRQSYSAVEIIAVNDRSDDNTGALMRETANGISNLQIIDVTSLPDEWLGKAHAIHSGVAVSRGTWLCFTDADVLFHADTLTRAMNIALTRRLDHLSLMPTLVTNRFLETVFVVVTWFFFLLHAQPWAISDPRSKRYCGIGAFNMIHREAYERIGTHERLRFELLDDMKLGKLVKTHGLRQDALNAQGFLKVQWQQGGLRSYLRGIEKNAFAGLNFRLGMVFATSICIFIVNILPFVFEFSLDGPARYAAVSAVLLLVAIHTMMSKHSGRHAGWICTHPAGCLFMLWSLWRSTALALIHRSVEWRGRRYPLAELRKYRV